MKGMPAFKLLLVLVMTKVIQESAPHLRLIAAIGSRGFASAGISAEFVSLSLSLSLFLSLEWMFVVVEDGNVLGRDD